MPNYTKTLQNYSGADRDTGLFNAAVEEANDPARLSFGAGQARRQCLIRSVDLEVVGDPVNVTFYRQTPSGVLYLWWTGAVTQTTTWGGGLGGLMTLPTNDDGKPWSWKTVVTGASVAGKLNVDWDVENTAS